MSRRAPPDRKTHEIVITALAPWTSTAKPVRENNPFGPIAITSTGRLLADHKSTGERFSATHDLFNIGGFRLTFVPTKDPAAPESIGRLEYVFRARSLRDVSRQLEEALRRFGFVAPLSDLIARASQIPEDLASLGIAQRQTSQSFEWAAGWTGFVKVFAEGSYDANAGTHRKNWMVELRAFQAGFRIASDP